MHRSRFARSVGFGVCLFAAAVSSLANGITLILCAEPDGCFELELAAKGASTSSACSGHEHELSPRDAAESRADSESVDACPCTDTVIASLSDTVRPGKGKSPSMQGREAPLADRPLLQVAVQRDCVEFPKCLAPCVICRPRHSQRSVVLRI